jgi:hypothetical protein
MYWCGRTGIGPVECTYKEGNGYDPYHIKERKVKSTVIRLPGRRPAGSGRRSATASKGGRSGFGDLLRAVDLGDVSELGRWGKIGERVEREPSFRFHHACTNTAG